MPKKRSVGAEQCAPQHRDDPRRLAGEDKGELLRHGPTKAGGCRAGEKSDTPAGPEPRVGDAFPQPHRRRDREAAGVPTRASSDDRLVRHLRGGR